MHVSTATRGSTVPGTERDGHRATWVSRLAGLGVVTVLLLTSGFAVWASQATNAAAAQAADASALSDAYADAATAVAAEESLERLYLTEPSPDVEAAYDQQAGAFATAVRRVQRLGDSSDRAVVARASAAHAALTRATMSLFRAFDRGDTERAQRIDLEDVDPPRATLEKAVSGAAESSHATTLALLAHLRDLERRTQLLTPLVFVIGVVIATLLVIVSRGDRRLLMAERAQARHDSLHDPLCGLPNRRLLTERLDQSLRKSDAGPAGDPALLLIDLDRFKEVNDTFGHRYGDELLIQVGSRLTGALRPVDTVARLGGDEFAVLIPHVLTLAEALRTAAELRATLEPSFHVFGVDLNVEASVGVVLAPQHGEDSVTLIQRADIAMYEAKASGSGVCSYERDIDRHSPGRLALLGELRGALERGELVLHYQPQLATGTGEVVGAEALVRWQHPTRGMVFPGEFIPLAEHTGLIGPLTRYVLSAALAQARTWADSGRPLRVSVNLSAKNLLDEHVADMVQGLLAMHGVDPHLLRLEVTESAMVDDSVRATRTLDRLAALPVSLSIDDFGAGYTSLGQLKALPVGELKIDKSFVLTMTDDPADAHIVEGIIAIGHRLGKTIVAEGVETEGALLALRQAGCDVAQGYLFSRPVPVEAFDTWRADRAAASAPPWGAGAGPAPLRPGLTAAAAPTSTPV